MRIMGSRETGLLTIETKELFSNLLKMNDNGDAIDNSQ